MWNPNQLFLCCLGESRPFSQIEALSIFLLTCRECTNCVFPQGQFCTEYWARPHSCGRPHPWKSAPQEQSYMYGPWWEMHPLECNSEETVWDLNWSFSQ